LFDWDNTLVDTFPVIHAAMSATLHAMGHMPWSEQETRDRVRLSLRDAFPTLFGARWEEARGVFYRAFEERHLDALRPMPGAEMLPASLARMGLGQAVVSNKTGRYLREEVAHLGWNAFFAALVGAGDAARDKPEPDPALLALESLGMSPGPDIWFVGDAGVDMEIAVRAGLTPVLLRAEPDPPGEFDLHPPVLRCSTPAALLEYLATQIT
jgi:phosphoglycolate phosphatase